MKLFYKNKIKFISINAPLELDNFNSKKNIIFASGSNLVISKDTAIIDNNKKIPSWWKDLPSGSNALSACPGVLDFLKNGYTMPMWADIDFFIDNNQWHCTYNLDTNHGDFGIDNFLFEQSGSCPATQKREIENSNFVKIQTPWVIKTPKGWSCLVLPHFWNSVGDYEIMPGVINTDYYHHINIVVNPLTTNNFRINYMDPLLHIIPFKRSKNLKILWGNEFVHWVLYNRGFGKIFKPKNLKGMYKKIQKNMDIEC